MNYLRNNPRKSLLIALYILVILSSMFFFHLSFGKLLLALLAATAIYCLILFTTFIAILGNYIYIRTGRANGPLRFAVRHDTPSPAAYLNYAVIKTRDGECEEALGLLDKAYMKNPGVIQLKNIELTKASCYWRMGDLEKSKNLLEDMRAKYEYVNEHVLTTLGYIYFCLNDLDKALEITMKAIEEAPGFGSAWDNLGQIYLRQNKAGEAKEAFMKAVECKADLPDSLYFLGVIARDEGRPGEAREYLEKALKCNITALNTVTREQVEEAYNAIGSDNA